MSVESQTLEPTAEEQKNLAKCAICGVESHSLYSHVKQVHGMDPDEYAVKHPNSPMLSAFGMRVLRERTGRADVGRTDVKTKDFDSMSVFGVGFGKANAGKPIRGYVGFTEADGVPNVDPHYIFPTELTKDFLMGFAAGERIYLSGPTGSGKTTLPEQIAARIGRPFERVQFHGEMEAVELSGTWFVNDRGVMEYMYSGLAKALQRPTMIVFDEYDSGNAVVSAIANAVLEGKPLVLGNKGGEKIVPHPDCFICATGNTKGQGDDTGLYASTSVQSFATMNRFGMFLTVDYMAEDNEKKLVSGLYPKMPPAVVADLIKVTTNIRNGFKEGKITAILSTRQLIKWGKWLNMTGDPKRAFDLAFANQLGQADEKVCRELYQRTFGK